MKYSASSGPSSYCRTSGGGISCKFESCKNNSYMSQVRFYRFPKEEKRCQAWVKACNNKKLEGIPASKLNASSRVCSDHFQDWCFMNVIAKHRLVANAIPNSPKPNQSRVDDISTADNAVAKHCLMANAIPDSPKPNQSCLNDISMADNIIAKHRLVANAIPNSPKPNQSYLNDISTADNVIAKHCLVVKIIPNSPKPNQSCLDGISTAGNTDSMSLNNHSNSSDSACEVNSTVLPKIENVISQSSETSTLKQLLLSPIQGSKVGNSDTTKSNSFNLGAAFSNASEVQYTDNFNSLVIARNRKPSSFVGFSSRISHSSRKYSPRELRLAKELKRQKDLTRRLTIRYNKVKEQLKISKSLPLNTRLINQGVQEKLANFVHRQVELSQQKVKKYNTYDKIHAYHIFSKSKAAYRALRELLYFPSERTLQRFISSSSKVCNTGLVEEVNGKLKNVSEKEADT